MRSMRLVAVLAVVGALLAALLQYWRRMAPQRAYSEALRV